MIRKKRTIKLLKTQSVSKTEVEPEIVAEPVSMEPEIVAEPVSVEPEIVAEPVSMEPEIVAEPVSVEPEIVAEPVSVEPEIVAEPEISNFKSMFKELFEKTEDNRENYRNELKTFTEKSDPKEETDKKIKSHLKDRMMTLTPQSYTKFEIKEDTPQVTPVPIEIIYTNRNCINVDSRSRSRVTKRGSSISSTRTL